MKLKDIFNEGIQHADTLVLLYDNLLSKSARSVRPEWRKRFFEAKLVSWPKRGDLWRSKNENLLIVGPGGKGLSHKTFSSEKLEVLLRSALVFAMAAVDKVLHEAVSKQFVSLVQDKKLDKLVKLDLSTAYEIAQGARIRKGKGGKIWSRPGHALKRKVLEGLYRESFLSLHKIEEISGICGRKRIFEGFRRNMRLRNKTEQLKSKWVTLYQYRNSIAHECDIVRKAKARKIHYRQIKPKEIKEDIDFIKSFGSFLAGEFDK